MKKLTLEEFNNIPNNKVFAKGEIDNSPEGIFITRNGGKLKWIAKKGDINDWTIYVYWNIFPYEYVEKHGDKLTMKENIQKVIPCSEEVMKLYRY